MAIRRLENHRGSAKQPQQQQNRRDGSKWHGHKRRMELFLTLCLGVYIGFAWNTIVSKSWSFAEIKYDSDSYDKDAPNYGIAPAAVEQGQLGNATVTKKKPQPYNPHPSYGYNADFHTLKKSRLDMAEIKPRAFPYWPQHLPLPCFAPINKTHEVRARVHRTRGLLFLKPIKVGSSTALGVNLRIAEHEAQRQGKNFTRCTSTHGHAMGHYFRQRNVSESFLWSMVRDPTDRVVSEFFHFFVTREKVEPSTENFKNYIRTGKVANRNYYMHVHAVSPSLRGPANVPSILRDYDFVGISERFEESMVVLQLLLRLPTSDILYLNAKRAGKFDDGGLRNTCYYIVPSFVSPDMRDYFEDLEGDFFQRTQKDYTLYYAVNQSLDATIDETIGRAKFDAALKKFRYAQGIINQECGAPSDAIFPCTSEGVKLQDEQTDCYHKDSGCGISCINRVVAERGL